MTLQELEAQFQLLMQRVEEIFQRRVSQENVTPNAIKQRHIDGLVVTPGLAADRPDGSTGVEVYWATDTQVLSLWNGSSWVSITLPITDWSTQVIYSGLAADRPDGSTDVQYYWATDTTTFSLWDGSSWQDIVLPISAGDPWVAISGTLTYSSADDPTFVASTSADLTDDIGLGARIRISQTSTKYFLVTAITSNSITLYGGTDYDLANATISDPYYSVAKAPVGFPTSPAKWTETLNDASGSDTITSATWTNIDSLSLDIPIGVWMVSYRVGFFMLYTGADQSLEMNVTLTQTDTTEDDTYWTTHFYVGSGTGGSASFYGTDNTLTRLVTLTSKTTYYVNEYADESSGAGSISAVITPTVVTAVSAYL